MSDKDLTDVRPKVLFSYSSKDAANAELTRQALGEAGYDILLRNLELNAIKVFSTGWTKTAEQADVMVALISVASMQSGHLRSEFEQILAMRIPVLAIVDSSIAEESFHIGRDNVFELKFESGDNDEIDPTSFEELKGKLAELRHRFQPVPITPGGNRKHVTADDLQIRKLGIIAGTGDLPVKLAKLAEASGNPATIISLKGFEESDLKRFNPKVIGIAEFGKIFRELHSANVSDIVFAGKIKRPDFRTLKPDMKGVSLLPKAITAARAGEDALLSFIIEVVENEGFNVIGADSVISFFDQSGSGVDGSSDVNSLPLSSLPEEIDLEPKFSYELPLETNSDEYQPIIVRDGNYLHSAILNRVQELLDEVTSDDRGKKQRFSRLHKKLSLYRKYLGSSLSEAYMTAVNTEGRSLAAILTADDEINALPEHHKFIEGELLPRKIAALLRDLVETHAEFIRNEIRGGQFETLPNDESIAHDEVALPGATRKIIEELQSVEGLVSRDVIELLNDKADAVADAIQSGPNPVGRPVTSLKNTLHNLANALSQFALKRVEQLGLAVREGERLLYLSGASVGGYWIVSQVLGAIKRITNLIDAVPWQAVIKFLSSFSA